MLCTTSVKRRGQILKALTIRKKAERTQCDAPVLPRGHLLGDSQRKSKGLTAGNVGLSYSDPFSRLRRNYSSGICIALLGLCARAPIRQESEGDICPSACSAEAAELLGES